MCVLLHASVIQERESTCPSEIWANWDYLEIFCPILTSHKMNRIKGCPYSVDLTRNTGRVLLQPFSGLYIFLSFSSCLLGLWLPLWRCIPPAGRNRSMLLVHQNGPCCQNTSEYNTNAKPQSLSPPFGTLNWDKTQMTGSESTKTSTKYTALDVDCKRK